MMWQNVRCGQTAGQVTAGLGGLRAQISSPRRALVDIYQATVAIRFQRSFTEKVDQLYRNRPHQAAGGTPKLLLLLSRFLSCRCHHMLIIIIIVIVIVVIFVVFVIVIIKKKL